MPIFANEPVISMLYYAGTRKSAGVALSTTLQEYKSDDKDIMRKTRRCTTFNIFYCN